jgi:hypothetical protein
MDLFGRVFLIASGDYNGVFEELIKGIMVGIM